MQFYTGAARHTGRFIEGFCLRRLHRARTSGAEAATPGSAEVVTPGPAEVVTPGLMSAPCRSICSGAMTQHRRHISDPARAPLIAPETLPRPIRRIAGFWLLALTLWLASAIALFR